ncbi:sensor histidine kinase [Brevibacillus sp. SYSU BS000544]|uniref:sensor histidine kinase n=1 Tax=Brevibacillus sp. SYSU BS000544 TaxID=3416443 RepID=UPI003CE484B2
MHFIIQYLFIDLPEALVYLFTGLALFNISLKQYGKKAIVFAFLSAIPSFILSIYEIYVPFKIFSLFLWMNLLLIFYLRIPHGSSIGISTSAFCISSIVEFSFLITLGSFDINVDYIFSNQFLHIFFVWLYLAIISMIGYTFHRNQFDIRDYFPKTQEYRYLSVIILIGSIELLTILLINTHFIFEQTNSSLPVGITRQLPYFHLVVLVLFVLMIILFRVYLNHTINRVETETQTPYLQNIDDLLTSIRSIKHDAVNHYTAINGMLQFGSYELATDYVNQLNNEATNIITVVDDVKNPAVSALLHSKMAVCIANRIDMCITVTSVSQLKYMKSSELILILGNLVDNSIRATLEELEENRFIRIEWSQLGRKQQITIENSGPCIPEDVLPHIFDLSYSTKPSGNGGSGLSIVKRIVERYKGSIIITSKDGVTRVCIQLPS